MKWKCLKCGREVDIWASICPYCWRHPGGLIEHLCFNIFKWFLIICGLMVLAVIGAITSGNNNSAPKAGKQPDKVQEQVTTPQSAPEEVDYNGYNTIDETPPEEDLQTTTDKDTKNVEHKAAPISSAPVKKQETKKVTSPNPVPVQKPAPKPAPKVDIQSTEDWFND